MGRGAAGRLVVSVAAALVGAVDAAGGADCRLEGWVAGQRWLLATIRRSDGEIAAGLANAHGNLGGVPPTTPWRAVEAARDLASDDALRRTIALATVNAVLNRAGSASESADGVDWLIERAAGRHVALVGRFPFIEDELRPVAGRVSVFELRPGPGEHGAAAMPDVLPAADVVVVTASTILNRSLDGILEHRGAGGRWLLLGPSTPLTRRLVDLGFDRLAGVAVHDVEQARRDVEAGLSFRRMTGTTRLSIGRARRDVLGFGSAAPGGHATVDG